MALLSHVALAFLLLDFLHNFRVSACADKPIFSPSTLIVKYGDPASAVCTVCPQACPTSNIGVEAPIGNVTPNGTSLSWSVNDMTEWEPRITCFYETAIGKHCITELNVTVYQPPTNVSISTEQDSGWVLEDHEYTLQCAVQGVAPIGKLQVTFYRGQTQLNSQQLKENKPKKPDDHTYTHKINARREDNEAQFWCEAKLELEDDGPQPPPVVESQKLTANVHYKPTLYEPKPSKNIDVMEGQVLHLNCSAQGNPAPKYTWTAPDGSSPYTNSVLTVAHVTAKQAGKYVCTVNNIVDSTSTEFHVHVQVDHTTIIIVVVIVAVIAVCIILAGIYMQYYRNTRMGQYRMKDVFSLRRQYVAGPTDA